MRGFGRWQQAVGEAVGDAVLAAGVCVWAMVAATAAVAADAGDRAGGVQAIRGLSGIHPSDDAIAAATAEMTRRRDAGDDDALVDALVMRAEALQAGNRLAQAGVDLAEARRIAERRGRSLRLARVEGAQAVLLLARGAHREALPVIEDSLAIARTHSDAAVEAAALITLGNFYAHPAAQLTDRAIDAYSLALQRSQVAGRPDLGARAALNLARAALADRDRGYAARGWHDAMAQIGQVSVARARVPLLLAAAELRRDLQDLLPDTAVAAAADILFRAAAAEADDAGMHPERARALDGLAAAEDAAGNSARALAYVVEARLLVDAERDPDLAFDLALHEARLRARSDDPEGARERYAEAVGLAGAISIDLAATDAAERASRFHERVAPAFSEYAAVLLAASRNESNPARHQATLAAVRDVVERFKSAELTNYFQDPCLTAATDPSSASRPAPAGTAYIYPIPIADQLTVLVSIGNVLSAETIPVPADQLARWADQFRAAAEHAPRGSAAAGRDAWTSTADAQRLYAMLLQPIRPRLDEARVDTLVFVPDTRLRVLPWSALVDGAAFLGDRYAVAVVPGVGSTETQPAPRGPIRPLICGLTVATQGFAGLPNIHQEIRSIHALYGGTVLQDEQCRLDTLRAALAASEFSVLHIATHAQFARSSEDTFLLTSREHVGMNDLERLIRPSRYRDQPVELVVLSACETAAGDDRAAIGLAGTALKAGARSVLATLWQIDDAASSQLVTSFYRHLADPALSKAQALRQAQQDLRRDPRTAHPYYWAGFVMIGNWM